MKKIILGLVLLFALGSTAKISAQEEVQRVKFYYYPSSNVYYNVSTGDYWYYDDVSATWTEVKALPTTVTFEKAPKYTVYYKGTDVWKENAEHMRKYKVKKDGEIKAKKPVKN